MSKIRVKINYLKNHFWKIKKKLAVRFNFRRKNKVRLIKGEKSEHEWRLRAMSSLAVPPDEEQKQLIDKVAQYVAKNGTGTGFNSVKNISIEPLILKSGT